MNPTQPIQNARNTLLSQRPGTVPNLEGAVLNYFRPLQLVRVRKETINGLLQETETIFESSGFLTPAKQKLQMKPEGQRKWKPWTLFVRPVVDLKPDDIVTVVNIIKGNTSYRVMGKDDFSESGFLAYDLAQDYS